MAKIIPIKQKTVQTVNPAVSIKTSSGKNIIIDDCFTEYMDMISEIIGVNINYNKFSKMSNDERKSFILGIKRNRKLKDLNI